MTRKTRRLYFVLLGLLAFGSAVALVMTAIGDDTMAYFFTPSDLSNRTIAPGRRLRVGGLVEQGSVVRHDAKVEFIVTDMTATLPVSYTGVLPDLFREGQGVVVEGRLDRDGRFQASEVLAKHDEKYMPKEVAEALKKSGRWQGDGKP
jgi:cytochrome c-type biogenesis protein CcmE